MAQRKSKYTTIMETMEFVDEDGLKHTLDMKYVLRHQKSDYIVSTVETMNPFKITNKVYFMIGEDKVTPELITITQNVIVNGHDAVQNEDGSGIVYFLKNRALESNANELTGMFIQRLRLNKEQYEVFQNVSSDFIQDLRNLKYKDFVQEGSLLVNFNMSYNGQYEYYATTVICNKMKDIQKVSWNSNGNVYLSENVRLTVSSYFNLSNNELNSLFGKKCIETSVSTNSQHNFFIVPYRLKEYIHTIPVPSYMLDRRWTLTEMKNLINKGYVVVDDMIYISSMVEGKHEAELLISTISADNLNKMIEATKKDKRRIVWTPYFFMSENSKSFR